MQSNTSIAYLARGQRVDLQITALRDAAENEFGGMFAESVALRRSLDNPAFSNDQYDAAVIGLVCGAFVRIRPLPEFLRQALAILLSLVPEKRAVPVTVPVVGANGSVQARSDRAAIEFVIDMLKDDLYPAASYAEGFTDLGCGLSGLSLTWRRDVLSEADADGVISVYGLRRISDKLSAAITESVSQGAGSPAIAGGKWNASKDDGAMKEIRRRLKLVEVIDRALTLGSTIRCVPSSERENRIAEAFEVEARRRAS